MNDSILIAISFLYIFLIIGIASFIEKSKDEKTELPRKFVHIMVGNWIFIAPFFEYYWTMIFTPLAFVILNYYALKSQRQNPINRRGDENFGTVYYAISLVFLTSLSYFTGKWLYALLGILIMAYGDGLGALFGIKYGSKYFTINPKKTREGSFIVFFFGFLISLILPLYYFDMVNRPFVFFLIVGLINGFYSFILELGGNKGLDNLLLPLGSGLMGGILIYYPSIGLFLTLILSCLILVFALKMKAVNLTGASIALLIGAILYVSGGIYLYLSLIVFFILGSLVTMIKNPYKASIKKDKFKKQKGRNGIQVLANSLPAVIFAIIFHYSLNYTYLLLAFTVFAGSGADTFASELGSLTKNNTVSIIGFKEVPKGLSGGISILGLLASLLGAFLLALFSYKDFGLRGLKFATILGFASSLIDSILGDLFQRKYRLKDGSLSDFKENVKDKPVRGFSFVSNNVVNFASLILVGLIGYILLI